MKISKQAVQAEAVIRMSRDDIQCEDSDHIWFDKDGDVVLINTHRETFVFLDDGLGEYVSFPITRAPDGYSITFTQGFGDAE